jgi:hypothetical protein
MACNLLHLLLLLLMMMMLLLLLLISTNLRLSSEVSDVVLIVMYLFGVLYVCVIDMMACRMVKYRFVLPSGLFVYHDVRICLLFCVFKIRPTSATITSFVSSKLNVSVQ